MPHGSSPHGLTDSLPFHALADRAALSLVQPPRLSRVLARVLGAAVLVTAVALVAAPWQQSASGSGRVVAFSPAERQQQVEAPIEGRVTRWHVQEGSLVRQGQLLAELTDNDPELLRRLEDERTAVAQRVEAARARVQALEARILQLTGSRTQALSAADARVDMARDRVQAAEQALTAAEASLATAQLQHSRQQALLAQGLTSARTAEVAELEQVRARTEVDRARASLSAARSELRALAGDSGRVGNDVAASVADARASRAAAEAEVASGSAELARMDVRLARQRTQAVHAPMDGTVLRLTGGLGGEMVKGGDPLLVLVPTTEARAVELWVDGNDVPLLGEGRPVRLQFEGWPAVQFTGWPSVAVGTFGGRVALVDSTDDGKGKFRVLVTPDAGDVPWPSGRYLRQGVRVNGWVLLEQVRLGYELWRRFNGFPPVVASAEPSEKGEAKGGK
jgi:multidrug resistance efflux pump